MNELYEFMKQVDVIVLFCLIYGLAINGIVWAVCEFISFVVKKVKGFTAVICMAGSEGFELSVIKVLKYDDPHEDHTAKLESLREQCLAADPNARRIWR